MNAVEASLGIPSLSPAHVTWRWRILLSTYIGYAGFYLTRNVFSVCKKPIMKELDVSVHDVAHLWSIFLISYCLGQFLVSAIGRRASARVLLLTGLGVSIAVGLLFGIENSYRTFMLLMFVNGLAQAMGWPGCVAAVAEWLRPRERSFLMGIWSTNLIVGNMMVKAFAGLFLGYHGWRYAYFGCSLMALATWVCMLLWQRDRPADVGLAPLLEEGEGHGRTVAASNAPHLRFKDYLLIIRSPIVVLMASGYFCVKFIRYSMDSWLPFFFGLRGLPADQSAYWSSACDLAGIPGMILVGWILSRWFRGNWALVSALLGVGMAIGYQQLTVAGSNTLAIAACYALIGFMAMGADSLLKGYASVQAAGVRNGAAVAGVVNGLGSISPVLQEEIIGYWVKQEGIDGMHRANALSLGIAVLFILIMALLAWQTHRRGTRKT